MIDQQQLARFSMPATNLTMVPRSATEDSYGRTRPRALRLRERDSGVSPVHKVGEHASRTAGHRPPKMAVTAIDEKIRHRAATYNWYAVNRHWPQSAPRLDTNLA